MPRTTVNVYPSGSKRTTSQRRNDQNYQVATLGTLLPFPQDSALTKDKISVIRLTSAYLKFQKFLCDAGLSQVDKLCNNSAGSPEKWHGFPDTARTIFSSLLSKALDGFLMMVDHIGTVLFASDEAADYISLTPSEITGHTLYEVSHYEDEEVIKKNLELRSGDIIEGNQVWRQFCIRIRSSMSGIRSQVTKFGGFNMIHISGHLKLANKDGTRNKSNSGWVTATPGTINNYQVVGLVAECHLIESPVIMELSVQHSTFTGVISMDLKFKSVDSRVTQLLGFNADDLVGQNIFDFFHPKDQYDPNHFVCWKKLMYQGRSISPVYRFLTKNGEWLWMQMCATLTYIPDTKTPYAANHTFRIVNADIETGKYKLIEHNEEYTMESNSCLPDEIKPHFPQPLNELKVKPRENENHVYNKLCETPLSETAREAFCQARNIGLNTFVTGMQPARLEDGTEPIQMIPDYTENATLDNVFVSPTMNCSGAIPYGPDLYVPAMYANGNSNHSASHSSTSNSSLAPSPASAELNLPKSDQQNGLFPSLSPESFSPSSGYASSLGEQSISTDHTPFPPSQQSNNHNGHLHHSPLSNSHGSSYQNSSAVPLDFPDSLVYSTLFNNSNVTISLPEIDLESLAVFTPDESTAPATSQRQHLAESSDLMNANGVKPPDKKHVSEGATSFSYVDSSIDEIIDQLLCDDIDNVGSYIP